MDSAYCLPCCLTNFCSEKEKMNTELNQTQTRSQELAKELSELKEKLAQTVCCHSLA